MMEILKIWALSITIFLPLAGAILLLFFPKQRVQLIRNFSLAISVVTFVISMALLRFYFPSKYAVFQLDMHRTWITEWGINYTIGIDGISLMLILLTTFLTPLVIWSTYAAINERVKEFMIFMLILETAMIGTFAALNMFLFYVFWELMLVPMYFLIGVWGGERRIYAAIKFFLYTMAGSVLMLLGILTLVWMNKSQTGAFSFEYFDFLKLKIPHFAQLFLFISFGLAFAIKVPMFPFHTWLPDAHVEAPTAGSVILAGVLLKMGTYGLLRFCIPLFPKAVISFLPHLMVLAIIGIIYGALVSMVQPDLKKLVAYSSVSHLGFVVLGMFSLTYIGIQGSVMQMINHGLSTGALFLAVGVIYERRHTRLISEFGGLAKVMPIFGTVFMIVMLSSVGLPGLNGFIGEFLILMGTYTSKAHPMMKIYAALAASGVIFAAVYLLWMYQRVMFGPVKNPKNESLPDLNLRELLIFIPIIFLIFLIGLRPKTFTHRLSHSVNYIVKRVQAEVPGHELGLTPGEQLLKAIEEEMELRHGEKKTHGEDLDGEDLDGEDLDGEELTPDETHGAPQPDAGGEPADEIVPDEEPDEIIPEDAIIPDDEEEPYGDDIIVPDEPDFGEGEDFDEDIFPGEEIE